jgi:hypothetical protein
MNHRNASGIQSTIREALNIGDKIKTRPLLNLQRHFRPWAFTAEAEYSYVTLAFGTGPC